MMANEPTRPIDQRNLLRSFTGLVALAAGVALCVRAGANLLIPAAFVVALFAFEGANSTRRYLVTLGICLVSSIAIGFTYASVAHRPAVDAIMVSSGLILASLSRLRRSAQ